MQKVTNIAIVIMAVCTVFLTGIVAHREFFTATVPDPRSGPVTRQVNHWQRLAGVGHVLGLPSAPIKIVEFSDFQCPYCAAADEPLRRMVERSHGQVAVIYRNYPLTQLHPYALEAAIAAECAADQGAFAAFHDALFKFQDSLGIWTWSKFARVAQVSDTTRLLDCVVHRRTIARIQRDRAVADSLRINGTPTFIVAGRLFMGMPSDSAWQEMLGLDR